MKNNFYWLNKYLDYQTLYLNRSKNSVLSYKYDIQKFIAYCTSNNLDYKNISIDNANAFIKYLSKDLQLSSNSINRIISTLRYYFIYLEENHQIKENIFFKVKNLNAPNKLPNFISYDDVKKIISYNPKQKFQQRNNLVVGLMFFGGLRISEVSTLCYDNIFLEDDYMIVSGKNSKQRQVFIVKELKFLLEEHIQSDKHKGKYLIKNAQKKQISRQSLWAIVKEKSVAIPTKITPHTLRHSFATYLMHKGLSQYDIKELLGHSSITSSEIYVHVTQNQLRETMNKKLQSINKIIIGEKDDKY